MPERRRTDRRLESGLPPLRSTPWFMGCVRRPPVRGWTTAAQSIDRHPTTPRQRRQTFFAVHARSRSRLTAVTDDSVTYTYKPTKSCQMLSRKVPGQAFVAGFAQHALPTGFHEVRHYGWMASNRSAQGPRKGSYYQPIHNRNESESSILGQAKRVQRNITTTCALTATHSCFIQRWLAREESK